MFKKKKIKRKEEESERRKKNPHAFAKSKSTTFCSRGFCCIALSKLSCKHVLFNCCRRFSHCLLSTLLSLHLLQSKWELLHGQGGRSVFAAGQLSTGSERSSSPQTCRSVHACTWMGLRVEMMVTIVIFVRVTVSWIQKFCSRCCPADGQTQCWLSVSQTSVCVFVCGLARLAV